MTVAEAEAARHPLLPGATALDDSVDERPSPGSSSAGTAHAGIFATTEASTRDQHGVPADASASAKGSPITGVSSAATSTAVAPVPVLPSFLPAAQDILPGAPPPLTLPPLMLRAPAPAATRPPVAASPVAASPVTSSPASPLPPSASPVDALPVPQDSLELLDWFDAPPVVEAPVSSEQAPAEHAVPGSVPFEHAPFETAPFETAQAGPDVSQPGAGQPGSDPIPAGVAAYIPVQPVPESVARVVVPPLPPFVPPLPSAVPALPSAVPGSTSVVASSTQPSGGHALPEAVSSEQSWTTAVSQTEPQPAPQQAPQAHFVPGPRVELGFRDGSHTQLDPAGEQAQALEELARTLTGF